MPLDAEFCLHFRALRGLVVEPWVQTHGCVARRNPGAPSGRRCVALLSLCLISIAEANPSMPSTYSNLLVHLVYSTKNRAPLIPPSLQRELCKYISGIVRGRN